MNFKYISILFVIFLFQGISAQDFNSSFFKDPTINKNDSSKLFLSIENTNFFKNDEYFGSLTSGLTYIGSFLRPELVYQPYSKVKIRTGAHLLKYSGLESYSQVQPTFSFQYSPMEGVDFIMGTFNGGANHRLIEPLYAFNHHLINNVENGAQLLIRRNRWNADVWLHWEKFILETSNSQESVIGGAHVNYIVLGKKEASNFKVDFQTRIAHKGGQFHKEEDVLQTIVNTATGFEYTKQLDSKLIKSIGTTNHYVTFSDPSPIPQYPYLMGYAISSEVFLNSKYIAIKAGYWSGEYFISTKGNPLYMSISEKSTEFLLPKTELITAKVSLKKDLYKDILFEARFESYLDVQQKQFEFSYSFYLIFNTDFFLKKL